MSIWLADGDRLPRLGKMTSPVRQHRNLEPEGKYLMFEAPFNWNSFWDLMTPAEAAATFRDTYGSGAAEAAAQCAIAALDDNRESDHRFWIAVSAELSKSDGTAAAAPAPLKH